MLGEAAPFETVPWFWSDQYDLTLQIAGLAQDAAVTISRPLDNGAILEFHLAADGRLLAASGIGQGNAIAKDIKLAELLIGKRARPDPVKLADPAVNLKSLLKAA